jgi:hypothetical protein
MEIGHVHRQARRQAREDRPVGLERDLRRQRVAVDAELAGEAAHRAGAKPELEIHQPGGFDFLLLEQRGAEIPGQMPILSGAS